MLASGRETSLPPKSLRPFHFERPSHARWQSFKRQWPCRPARLLPWSCVGTASERALWGNWQRKRNCQGRRQRLCRRQRGAAVGKCGSWWRPGEGGAAAQPLCPERLTSWKVELPSAQAPAPAAALWMSLRSWPTTGRSEHAPWPAPLAPCAAPRRPSARPPWPYPAFRASLMPSKQRSSQLCTVLRPPHPWPLRAHPPSA
mmetsp:Transcript_98540/g.287470  ORF Transcript_98540/g.287470 Transcript_98540/m.287470 type:complete len:201 (+) Transcript_98540:385-987(+)